MQRRYSRGGANRKIVQVNNKLGIKNIQNQQGTTRVIYDALPISNANSGQTLRFFENVNNRQFPFTNINENKLQVGESLALQRFSVALLTTDVNTGAVLNVLSIDNIAAGTNALYRSDLSFSLAQDTVIKKLPLHSMYAPFNKDSKFYGNIFVNPGAGPPFEAQLGLPQDVFYFDNDIIVPQQIEFVAELRLPQFTLTLNAFANYYLLLTMEGLGSLFSPKTAY